MEKKDNFTRLVTAIVLLGPQLSSPRGWKKLGVEIFTLRG
jgi:hypothetical protein